MKNQKADKHCRQRIIDAECPLVDKSAAVPADDAADDPCKVCRMIHHQSPVQAPCFPAEPGVVNGKTFIGNTIGEKGQFPAGGIT